MSDAAFSSTVCFCPLSISALQWLCNADKRTHSPPKRLYTFFSTLYSSLVRFYLHYLLMECKFNHVETLTNLFCVCSPVKRCTCNFSALPRELTAGDIPQLMMEVETHLIVQMCTLGYNLLFFLPLQSSS